MTTDPVGRGSDTSGFLRGLGRLDATMVVAGSMIGSGVFIVSADIARLVGSAGWLLTAWLVTGVLTVIGALAYGELASMMPRAGGQYVFLREAYSPFWGFLFGWTLFLVIQTGTISAVAVAFSRFLGVLAPGVSPSRWIVPPVDLSASYAVSLSTQQLVAIVLVALLTFINTRGLALGKLIQNVFTSTKLASLVALAAIGLVLGAGGTLRANLASAWTPQGAVQVVPDLPFLPATAANAGIYGLIVALCVAQVGSLFASVAWENVTFVASEVREPHRNVPIALATGAGVVIALYFFANLAYLGALPLSAIQHAPDDRVATAALQAIFGGAGAGIMALAIMVSTFGCNNGLILTGARVYYAMARDGLFFASTGRLNARHVPAAGLVLQGIWASVLILPRTRLRAAGGEVLRDAAGSPLYGNLYSNLLDYVVFSVLIFYILTIMALFVMRIRHPETERPYRAFGYPVLPALYIVVSAVIVVVLAAYRSQTTWPGLVIVLTGVPVYFLWRRYSRASDDWSGRSNAD
ncbi:MAG TPA: amino acid permease [Thermoanaerobaculaceae bacterium]|nr:amino acid permease [Thermoanaerobaculaceae bacterium]